MFPERQVSAATGLVLEIEMCQVFRNPKQAERFPAHAGCDEGALLVRSEIGDNLMSIGVEGVTFILSVPQGTPGVLDVDHADHRLPIAE
ncbi:MAG: hypothetical protein H0V63_07710 [Burkholderiaceae bacterium]|nr:hypothetical protein [Burkholderiaceae bacterium]